MSLRYVCKFCRGQRYDIIRIRNKDDICSFMWRKISLRYRLIYMKRESNRVSAAIKGRVQGVSYRYYTLREADRLGLRGWVRNERDGSVKAVAEGNPVQLEDFISFLRRGSPAARVSSIDVEWLESTGEYDRFEIRWA